MHQSNTHVRRASRWLLAAGLLLGAAGSQAVQELSVKLGTIRGPAGITAQDVVLQVDFSGRETAGVLRIGRLQLGSPERQYRDLQLRCPRMLLSDQRVVCRDGQLQVDSPLLAQARTPVSFEYRSYDQTLTLELSQVITTYNSANGEIAADGLGVGLELTLQQQQTHWNFQGSLRADAGQAYLDPVFLDFAKQPAQISFAGRADSAQSRISLSRFELSQPGVLAANGSLVWAQNSIESANVEITRAQLPAAYVNYAQPFFIGTVFGSLNTWGELRASVVRDAQGWSAISVSGQDLAVQDDNNRLSLTGGAIGANWRRDGELAGAQVSRLSWREAAVYKIALGPTELDWRMAGDDLVLIQGVSVPVFDGRLEIERAEARALTSDNPKVDFNARLTPVRLAKVTRALGWPEFKGQVSGVLPSLQYRQGELVLAGGLQARALGGDIDISEFSIADPLGARPRLRADARARNLDLQTMSSAFSFGRITGRLDADVTGLRMLGWQPVAFKAWLRTPKDDNSRHRISQRAIDDIASLGGGGAGLVSRGFLGLFDDFAYDRIGLGCILNQGVCSMRGLGPAEDGGYVIVRGRWLPRIDVVGYNRRVSWPVLLEQLKSVSAGDGPVINPENPPAR